MLQVIMKRFSRKTVVKYFTVHKFITKDFKPKKYGFFDAIHIFAKITHLLIQYATFPLLLVFQLLKAQKTRVCLRVIKVKEPLPSHSQLISCFFPRHWVTSTPARMSVGWLRWVHIKGSVPIQND